MARRALAQSVVEGQDTDVLLAVTEGRISPCWRCLRPPSLPRKGGRARGRAQVPAEERQGLAGHELDLGPRCAVELQQEIRG